MDIKKIAIVVAMAAGSLMANAHAKDQGHGTVKFEGSIVDAPCSISEDTNDQTVDLGEVSNVALKNGGSSVPTPFYVKLEQCDTSALTKKTVTTTFTGAASAGNPDLLGITGTAKGASIAITDGSGTVVKLGTATAAQVLADGENTLAFSAYLQGDNTTAPIVPGSFTSIANFTLAYQ
ncbi:fimbrial protein [Atlantibacter sp.]|uniref:fimbrial protein n=1 Tax=Atlantibacter sp. TaxID=1903473 RepID=UPI0028A8262A|nr:fimbrial protein [Atlantibacter sp.]